MKRDNRGVGALIVVVIILVLAVIGGVGFLLLKRSGKILTNAATSVVSSAETQKAFDDCKKEFSDDDLCKALSNFMGAKQYQSTITSVNGGSSFTIIQEKDGDKSYNKQNFSGKTLETIYAGNTTYTKDNSDGKWWKQIFETSTSNTSDDFKFDTNISDTTTKTTYTKEGEEACDKLTCIKYKITTSDSKDTQYIWIDKKEHLVRKWSTESSNGSKFEAVYTYNNKPVEIPNLTKDASPTQNVIPADFYSGMNMGGDASNDSSSEDGNESTSSSTSDDTVYTETDSTESLTEE